MQKRGLIAGGGSRPVEIARHCERSGRPLFVIRLKGFAGTGLEPFAGAEVGLAELGKCIKALRRAGCEAVCLAGNVSRPDFSSLLPDLRGLAVLPAAIAAARRGDDALLRMLVGEFEKEGFAVEGAPEVMDDLGLPIGLLGAIAPGAGHMADAERALHVARAIGALDIGQAAAVCRGLVLAVEAIEGTDAMLTRAGALRRDGFGGVLVKLVKPGQDKRADLPTVGPDTVRNAAAAGLRGLAFEAGATILAEREACLAVADAAGLFLLGLDSEALS